MPLPLPLSRQLARDAAAEGSVGGLSLQLPSALTAILTSRKAEAAEIPSFFGDVSTLLLCSLLRAQWSLAGSQHRKYLLTYAVFTSQYTHSGMHIYLPVFMELAR